MIYAKLCIDINNTIGYNWVMNKFIIWYINLRFWLDQFSPSGIELSVADLQAERDEWQIVLKNYLALIELNWAK